MSTVLRMGELEVLLRCQGCSLSIKLNQVAKGSGYEISTGLSDTEMTGNFSKVRFYGIGLEARRRGSLGDKVRK